MAYKSLESCIKDLDKTGQLIRIKEEVDPYLEMSSIQLRAYKKGAPAILFEKIKGCEFKALSNLFGDVNRSRFLFRDTMEMVQNIALLKKDPMLALKKPLKYLSTPKHLYNALPKKVSKRRAGFVETTIDKLPQITCWKKDGGPFITLPIVYTEDVEQPGWMKSNMGMYRIQLGGNEYKQNEEIGLHYQIHRGIGVHQSKANAEGQPLKVSIFVGGPPSLSFSAVMPLPEGLPEFAFAGMLGGKRIRYFIEDGYTVCADADFVITGEVMPHDVKPEGPFGDHLGYYSLTHDFPVMKVEKVYAKKNAIWPFTVVGRPPQEDSQFGALIHEITDGIIPKEIPGLKAVNAVDEAGVHPLLLAIGSERYTPYNLTRKPQEILTIANHILGKGQLSLAKYLFIVAQEDNPKLDVQNEYDFFQHVFERVDWSRDLHFQTKTTIDTLDYSSTGEINEGSKVVCSVAGEVKRSLCKDLKECKLDDSIQNPYLLMPGVLIVEANDIEKLKTSLYNSDLKGIAFITLVDDSEFVAKHIDNWLWVTFTRSNPAEDIFGLHEKIENKHWSSDTPIVDARVKEHHAPGLHMPGDIIEQAQEKINRALNEK